MIPLTIIAVAAIGYGLHEAIHGHWMALEAAGFMLAVYAAAFVGEWIQRRRSANRFHAKFVRPAELRVERDAARRRSF